SADVGSGDPPEHVDLAVSAVTGAGVDRLVGRMAELVRAARDEEAHEEGFVVHRPAAEGFRVEREDDGSFVVIGRDAERAGAVSALTNLEGLDFARQRLGKLGVDRALARAGARDGDRVRIGGMEFDYEAEP